MHHGHGDRILFGFKKGMGQLLMVLLVFFFFESDGPRRALSQDAAETHDPKKAARRATVAPEWPHAQSDLSPDPDLYFGRLPNGFRFVLMNNREPRSRVSMHLNVQVGSLHEKEDEQGLAHFLEHMLFNGSTHYPPGELVKYFQRIGMQFGPDANAHTGFTETAYDILLPKGDLQGITEALTVFKDFAQGALLLDSEIEREIKVVLAEKRERDSAAYRTYVRSSRFEFGDARLSHRFPIGTEEVLRQLDRSRVKAFYDRWYRPEKMILVMVGDFEIHPVISKITEQFQTLEPRMDAVEDPDLGEIRHEDVKSFHHYEKEAGSTTVSLEVMRRVSPRPDTKAARILQLRQEAAHRVIQERLDAVLAAPHPPFSDAAIGGGLFLREIEYAEIHAEGSPDQWEKILILLEKTLRQALTFGFTEAELDRVKKEMTAELDQGVKGAETRNSRYLARKIIAALNNARVFLSPGQEKALFGEAVAALTPESVRDALQTAWKDDHRLILVTGNVDLSGGLNSPEARIRTVFKASRTTPVSEPASDASVRFPYLPKPVTGGEVLRKVSFPDLGMLQVDFSNGVRLNLKKTDFTANEVRANLVFGFGRSDEPAEKTGIGLLAEALINESGTGRLSQHELSQALAGTNTGVTFRVAEDHFAFKGTSVTGEIELLFQLMTARLLDPGYRESAFALVMERFRQAYAERAHSVEDTLRFWGTRFLAGEDGRFGYPPMEQLRRLTLQDVKDWTTLAFEQAALELSVVGDFDTEAVLSLASRYFGSLAQRPGSGRVRTVDGIRFPEGKARTFEIDTRIPKALVVIAYPTEDIRPIGKSRRLNVMAEVLSERLREAIREKRGAAYSPVAYHHPSRTYPGYGVLWTMAYTDPEIVDPLISEMRAAVTALFEDTIPQEEFQRALDPIRTGIKDMLRRNGYWLDTVMTGSRRYPDQLEWSRTLSSDYATIIPGEVSHLARTYLKPEKAAILVFRPKPGVP